MHTYQRQKEKFEATEKPFCRVFIFYCLASIMGKHGSDDALKEERISQPACEERYYKIMFVTIVCTLCPGILNFLKYKIPHIECGIECS